MKNPPLSLTELRAILANGYDFSDRITALRGLVLWYLEEANVTRAISTTCLGEALLYDVWGLRREDDRDLCGRLLRYLGSRPARQSMTAAVGFGPESRRMGKVYRTYVWKRPDAGWTPEERSGELTPIDTPGESSHKSSVCPHCRGTGKL